MHIIDSDPQLSRVFNPSLKTMQYIWHVIVSTCVITPKPAPSLAALNALLEFMFPFQTLMPIDFHQLVTNCLEHKPDKCMLLASDKKGRTDILIIYQLHSFVMSEQYVLNMFVL